MKENLSLGIDVSKGYADFELLNPDMTSVELGFQLDDTPSGHEKLGNILEGYIQSNPELVINCAVESTGGYERNWYNYLLSLSERLPIKIALINPVVTKGISKASLNRTVTDGVSAMNIARYLISYQEKVNYSSRLNALNNPFKTGRSLYTYEKMIIKQKVQLSNQLEKLLYQYFSEMLVYCRHGSPQWLLRILAKYPSAEKVKKAGVDKLIRIQGIGPVKARKIFEKACKNTQKTDNNICFIIANTCSEILHKLDKISQSKAYLEKTFKDNNLVKLLCTINGISYSSAISILFEIEDINRFIDTKKIASYFGLNPEYKDSGDGKAGNHMSKKGRKLIRATLYMCCMTAVRYDPHFKKKYAAIRANGKCHYFAMGVVMHKMLRIIFGVLKSESPYDPMIDEKNQERGLGKQADIDIVKKNQQKGMLQKKRRYQNIDLQNTPISRRKAQRIKKLEEPQEVQSFNNTGSDPVKNKINIF